MGEGGWTRTTCPYCGVGCGVLARARGDGSAEIKGDPEHPANFGRLCSKGSALGETMGFDGRLVTPMIGGRRCDWDEALDLVAARFQETIAAHGPDSVALYVSGQILTEDYYVANKLMKGFVGSANIDTNSRLCMASSVAGHKRAFGSDTVPGTYEDLELADLVVLVGSNLAWCHPVLFQRLSAARERNGTRVIVIDPRRTATCEIADLHLAIAPGGDVALFNGLLAHLADAGRIDTTYVAAHTSGLGEALATARALDRDAVCEITGLTSEAIGAFYAAVAGTEKTVTVYSQGVNQSSAGTDKVNAIINCHLATGRIGRPGMGPFSVTGQPNAMGGREAGGLANMLAAHMELADPAHRRIVQSFWTSPTIASAPGLKAVDLFEAVGAGRIKALWIMATNPADSLPDADAVRDALEICPFVVVSDVVADNDTMRHAHVRLPALAWGEKDGTVTNSERRISRQRTFATAPPLARADWWQIGEVAKRLGFGAAFAWDGPAAIFREYAALTGCENGGARDLDISAYAQLDAEGYAALAPFQWPQPAGVPPQETRFFADGGYFTPDARGRFVATPFRATAQTVSEAWPFLLNTGRLRDQWHTMTRTARAPRLMLHAPEPCLDMHPADAARLGIASGDLVEVESANGTVVLRLVEQPGQRPGEVFAPIHWTDQLASQARVDTLVAPICDPVSGQPESKATPVAVRRCAVAWHGFALNTTELALAEHGYFAVARTAGGYRCELAGKMDPDNWEALARAVLGLADDAGVEMLAYHDTATGQHRFAAFRGDVLVGALFAAREPVGVSRTWAAEQLGRAIAAGERLRLLAGRPGGEVKDRGPIVCACFEVGRNEIVEAIVAGGCRTAAAVGEVARAGTNCGSCRAEIGRLIDAAELQKTG
ncbi:MAG: molybdopterin-dependent oxidoreductase [Hyphomicrobiaceae bacterium]